ncbi:MAG: RNA polymerase sigma factor, partial [Chitinophagaceae bacterium]
MVLQICKGYMKGDDDLAKDLAQDVFINVWNALSKFRGEALHKTWIYRITVNTCLLYIRNNKNKQTASFDEVMDITRMPAADKDTNQYSSLYQAIGMLPELDRLIMMLLLEDLEYSEICEITGISSVNLRVKIHRIKIKMKEILKEEL